MKVCLAACVLLMSAVAEAGEVSGKVVSVNRGEALRQVQVTVLELKRSANTGDDGTFAISEIPPGSYTLRVTAVGYRLVTTPFTMASAEDTKEFSITLAPDNFRRTEVVDVKGDIFQVENPAIPGQMVLNAAELKEASTVLGNDPFRAVQAMPGVSPSQNNDLLAEFSLFGAPFSAIGVYFDDVVVRAPFHTLPDFTDGASLSILSSETVEAVNLMPVAYPESFGEGTGGALQMRTREGSRGRPLTTFAPGLADTELTVEGGLGKARKGSWLLSGRKSYIGYLVHRTGIDTSDIELQDGSLKLEYDLTPHHNVSFYALSGHTDLNRHDAIPRADLLGSGDNQFDLSRVGWKYVVSAKLLLETHAAYLDERFEELNPFGQLLGNEYYGEWLGGTKATWNWRSDQVLEAGYTARRLRDGGTNNFFNSDGTSEGAQRFDLTGLRQTGYVQQTSGFLHARLHVMAGLRWDHVDQVDANPLSPQVSVGLQAGPKTQLQFGFGRYTQYPDFTELAQTCDVFPQIGSFVRPAVMVTNSNHFTAAVEQRLGENIRARVQAFERTDHTQFGSRTVSPGSCAPVTEDPVVARALDPFEPRTRARGLEFLVQRRSANRLSGWISYTLDVARQTSRPDPASPVLTAPTLTDQRHTLNLFATYRLRPTVNLSGKFLYGSGFPFPSTVTTIVGHTVVTVAVNPTSLPAYQRLDIRMDKSWAFARWKMTLHAEGLNMTNHNNPRLIGSVFDVTQNRFVPLLEKGFPILPTTGLTFEF